MDEKRQIWSMENIQTVSASFYDSLGIEDAMDNLVTPPVLIGSQDNTQIPVRDDSRSSANEDNGPQRLYPGEDVQDTMHTDYGIGDCLQNENCCSNDKAVIEIPGLHTQDIPIHQIPLTISEDSLKEHKKTNLPPGFTGFYNHTTRDDFSGLSSRDHQPSTSIMPLCPIQNATLSNGFLKEDDDLYQLEQAVARPKCPTISCSIKSSDRSLFASPLVQWTAKSVDIGPTNEHIKDIICGVSTPAEVRLGRDTLQLDNSFYWCNFCPFKAVTKEDFVSHVAIHRFSCKLCSFQAFSRAEVVRHTCVEHPNVSESQWQFCSFGHDCLKIKQNRSEESIKLLYSQGYDLLDMCVKPDERKVEDVVSDMNESSDVKPSWLPNMGITEDTDPSPIEDTVEYVWKCVLCDFVSLNYELVTVHGSIMHPSSSTTAKSSPVTSTYARQLIDLDMTRCFNLLKRHKKNPQPLLPTRNTCSSVSNAIKAQVKYTTCYKELQSLNTKGLYECIHCKQQLSKTLELKHHLQTYHKGEAFAGINLVKTSKLRQRGYFVCCVIPECNYSTQSSTLYKEHFENCLPNWKGIATDYLNCIHKSAERTMEFGDKRMTINEKYSYFCGSCYHKCHTVDNIKAHVQEFHNTKTFYHFSKIPSEDHGNGIQIHFCPICTSYKSRKHSTLCKHLVNQHSGDPRVHEYLNAYDRKPNNQELRKMMEEYFENETKTNIAALGSSARPAAVKAKLKMKNADQVPCHYQCRHCQHQCYGSNLMKAHIATDHKHLSLVAQDIKKKANHQQSLMYLCPSPGCSSVSALPEDAEMKEHCLEVHEKDYDVLQEQLVAKYEYESSEFQSQKGSYLCLYCSEKVVMKTTLRMRDHVISNHPGEEVIMRDLVARKNKVKQCRIYMCAVENCYFITFKRKLHKKHILYHLSERTNAFRPSDKSTDLPDQRIKSEVVDQQSDDTCYSPIKKIKIEPVFDALVNQQDIC